MWITIDSNANYSLRARTVAGADGTVIGSMLVGITAAGGLVFAQFVTGYTAEQIQAGW